RGGGRRLRFDRLRERAAGRDHWVHVRLLFDYELDHRRTRRGIRLPDRVGQLTRIRHSVPWDAICFSELQVVGASDRRAGVALAVEELLPLPHHPEIAVVEYG